jgi:hypothetical protein
MPARLTALGWSARYGIRQVSAYAWPWKTGSTLRHDSVSKRFGEMKILDKEFVKSDFLIFGLRRSIIKMHFAAGQAHSHYFCHCPG